MYLFRPRDSFGGSGPQGELYREILSCIKRASIYPLQTKTREGKNLRQFGTSITEIELKSPRESGRVVSTSQVYP